MIGVLSTTDITNHPTYAGSSGTDQAQLPHGSCGFAHNFDGFA